MSSARAVQAETSPEGVSCSTHRRSRSRMRASTRAWSIGIMGGKDLVRMAFRQPLAAFVGGLDRGEDTEADRRIGVQDPLDRWRPTPDVSGTGRDRGIGTAEGCVPPDGDGVVVASLTTTPCLNGRITPATAASRPQARDHGRGRGRHAKACTLVLTGSSATLVCSTTMILPFSPIVSFATMRSYGREVRSVPRK